MFELSFCSFDDGNSERLPSIMWQIKESGGDIHLLIFASWESVNLEVQAVFFVHLKKQENVPTTKKRMIHFFLENN
jgi:hypothetical protein